MVNQTQSKCDANNPTDRIIFDNGKAAIFRTELESNHAYLLQLIDGVNTGQVDSIVKTFTNFMFDKSANVIWKKAHSKPKANENLTNNK